jgi:hypothetical protein
VHGPRVDPMPITAIQRPLFNVLLARINDPTSHTSQIGDWLLDQAGWERSVSIDLPFVTVLNEGGPQLVSYQRIVREGLVGLRRGCFDTLWVAPRLQPVRQNQHTGPHSPRS